MSKTKTDDQHIIAPVVSKVTKANNKSSTVKPESSQIETLQQALLTQKVRLKSFRPPEILTLFVLNTVLYAKTKLIYDWLFDFPKNV